MFSVFVANTLWLVSYLLFFFFFKISIFLEGRGIEMEAGFPVLWC